MAKKAAIASLTSSESSRSANIVLSSFMGGLALGSTLVALYGHRVRHFLRTYAALEIFVAVSGVGVLIDGGV